MDVGFELSSSGASFASAFDSYIQLHLQSLRPFAVTLCFPQRPHHCRSSKLTSTICKGRSAQSLHPVVRVPAAHCKSAMDLRCPPPCSAPAANCRSSSEAMPPAREVRLALGELQRLRPEQLHAVGGYR